MTAWEFAKGILMGLGILVLLNIVLSIAWDWLIEWDSKRDK